MARETIKSVKDHAEKTERLLLARIEELEREAELARADSERATKIIEEHLDEHRNALAKQIQVMESAIKQRAVLEGAIVNGQELLREIAEPEAVDTSDTAVTNEEGE